MSVSNIEVLSFQTLRHGLHRSRINSEAVYQCTVGGRRENVPSSSVTSSIHTGYSHIISYQQCVHSLSNLWDARYGLCSVVSVMSTPVHSSRPIPSPVFCHSPPFPGTVPCLPFPLYCILYRYDRHRCDFYKIEPISPSSLSSYERRYFDIKMKQEQIYHSCNYSD